MHDVVVTGTGVVSALGGDTSATWRALLDGRSAARAWDDLADEGFPVQVACRVDDSTWRPQGPPEPSRRGRALALRAASEALGQAGLLDPQGRLTESVDPARVGCFLGTTMGESAVFERAADRGSFDLAEGGGQVFAETIASSLGVPGPRRTFGTACAAGNYAIAAAARAVASGRVDVAVAGGVEPFSRIAMLGFARMRAMAPSGCAPFGRGRRGMTLGEGAGVVVLQRRSDAAAPLARIGALGLSADAHHPTAPREDGVQMAAAMRSGLERTGLAPSDVGWVSAHGTGTPRSDAVEALALRGVFGDGPPVSSIKGALGHTLGAATAIEAVAAVCALREGTLPPNSSAVEADLDETLDVDIVRTARSAPDLAWVMNCGFAFGGLNSALLIGSPA